MGEFAQQEGSIASSVTSTSPGRVTHTDSHTSTILPFCRLAPLSQLGVATIGEGATHLNALVVEFMCTMILSMAMLHLFRAQDTVGSDGVGGSIADLVPETTKGEDAEPRASLNSIVIGLLLLVLQIVAAPVSGASLNPAKTFGTAVWSVATSNGVGSVWMEQWIYWLGPTLGATAAAFFASLGETESDGMVFREWGAGTGGHDDDGIFGGSSNSDGARAAAGSHQQSRAEAKEGSDSMAPSLSNALF